MSDQSKWKDIFLTVDITMLDTISVGQSVKFSFPDGDTFIYAVENIQTLPIEHIGAQACVRVHCAFRARIREAPA